MTTLFSFMLVGFAFFLFFLVANAPWLWALWVGHKKYQNDASVVGEKGSFLSFVYAGHTWAYVSKKYLILNFAWWIVLYLVWEGFIA